MIRMTRWMIGAVFAALFSVACSGSSEPEDETPAVGQVEMTEQGSCGPMNCVATCVCLYRLCLEEGDPKPACEQERDSCKKKCPH